MNCMCCVTTRFAVLSVYLKCKGLRFSCTLTLANQQNADQGRATKSSFAVEWSLEESRIQLSANYYYQLVSWATLEYWY